MNVFIIVSKHGSKTKWRVFVTQSCLLYDNVTDVVYRVKSLNKQAHEFKTGFRYAYAPITFGDIVEI